MRALLRRHLSTLAAIAITALLVGGGPLAAAVFDAQNADKVDGFHAVGAGATPTQRAGKLVGTNAAGRLPNTIIAKAPDADQLDGLNSTELQKRVSGTCSDAQKVLAVGATGGVSCSPDRINGGNATTLDNLDSTQLQRKGIRTVLVSPSGTPTENGLALVEALTGLNPAPGPSNRWVIKLEPGTYDISDVDLEGHPNGLRMRSYVDIHGAGASTLITCVCGNASFSDAATVVAASNSELADLSVTNIVSSGGDASGLYSSSVSSEAFRLRNVVISADGTGTMVSIIGAVLRGSTSVSHSTITGKGGAQAIGAFVQGGTISIADSTVIGRQGAFNSFGVSLDTGTHSLFATQVIAEGSPTNNDALIGVGTIDVAASALTATGASPTAVNEESGTFRIATSKLTGVVAGAPECVLSYNGTTHAELGAGC